MTLGTFICKMITYLCPFLTMCTGPNGLNKQGCPGRSVIRKKKTFLVATKDTCFPAEGLTWQFGGHADVKSIVLSACIREEIQGMDIALKMVLRGDRRATDFGIVKADIHNL